MIFRHPYLGRRAHGSSITIQLPPLRGIPFTKIAQLVAHFETQAGTRESGAHAGRDIRIPAKEDDEGKQQTCEVTLSNVVTVVWNSEGGSTLLRRAIALRFGGKHIYSQESILRIILQTRALVKSTKRLLEILTSFSCSR